VIETLRLQNFRGFDDHVVPLRDVTIMVGANNAGKSTVVEAIRLVALVTERFRRSGGRFVGAPEWLSHPLAYDGLSPVIRGMPADGIEHSVFHRYGAPPSVITATFESGATVMVFVGPEAQVHGVARRSDGSPVSRASTVRGLGLDPVAVQPQVAPLLREELVRQDATVRRGDGTYLASQHFRNQLALFSEHFEDFVEIAEHTWRGLQIKDPPLLPATPNQPIRFDVRDEDFFGEISLMGHGLQMWLQIVWFLSRAPSEGTIVLDEPDVYMHPDLQRRLLNLVRSRFRQLIIATHSIEIIADVDPSSILSIDRRRSASRFVTSLPGLQEVLDGIGSVQNIQIARLMRSHSFYLVEGQDVRLLRLLQAVAMPARDPIDLVPHAQLDGRAGWGSGIPARLPRTNAEGRRIRSFAILDRDYYPDDEIAERYTEARQWSVQLRVWSRKEIENYLLVPEAIARLIAENTRANGARPDAAVITERIDEIVEALREDPIQYAMATVLHTRDKSAGLTKAMKSAKAALDARWITRADSWAAAPGKKVIARLSEWSKDEFGVSFGAEQIARVLKPEEVAPEVVEVLTAIVEGRPLLSPFSMPAQEPKPT
jgi:AAA domain, putative AbiEii toxin, Type IV TA system/AAA ATPase domain